MGQSYLALRPISRRAVSILVFTATAMLSIQAAAIDDPITPDHPLWFITRGSAVVDGSLSDEDWANAVPIERAQAYRDGPISVRMLYSSSGLFLSVEVADENLWVDGNGGGAGSYFEVEQDDSISFYFDLDESREEYLQDADRGFAVNLGNPSDPLNGSGIVRRCKYVKGNGSGGVPDVIGCDNVAFLQMQTGIEWASAVNGTVNNPADVDTGWTTEILLPWAALGISEPSHGQTVGMNFDLIFDNDGGFRNFTDNSTGPNRFELPRFTDDHVQGAHSAYSDSLASVRGPVSYAKATFVDPAALAKPEAIADLAVAGAGAFGARLTFSSPGAAGAGIGHVASYEVRYGAGPITTEQAWEAATVFEQRYVPRPRGLAETLRIAALNPSTSYGVAVRARAASGQLGDLSNSPSIVTLAASGPEDRGRVIPAPAGSGLVFEDGTPFVMVGEHLGMSWGWFRNLYPGDIWDVPNQIFQDYNANPSFEGPAGPHFEDMAAKGVNTLRVFLEILNTDQTGNVENPRGRYWIEFPSGTFNLDMRQFVLNALAEADANDMYLIFSPFDTFSWDDVFMEETPWYTGNGGPLTDIDDFFQNSQTMGLAQDRIAEVLTWVGDSPHADRLLGWEPLNEWDSPWTLNSEGDAEAPGRENEFRRRAIWMHDINQWVRDQDPDRLVFSSTTTDDPRGPRARAFFYDRTLDVLAPHFYTSSNEEPINNPASDVKVRPAVENGLLSSYWITHRNDPRPLMNGEWGMTSAVWPGGRPEYSASFTQQEDEALYRTVSWSGLATGQASPGLRIAHTELEPNNNSLTEEMRNVELALANFVASQAGGFDFSRYLPRTLAGNIEATSVSGAALLAWGSTDGQQGIAYVLQDGNETSGNVSDGQLTLHTLAADEPFRVEVWDTSNAVSPLSVTNELSSGGGSLTVPLPQFSEDVAVKFVPEPSVFAAQLAALGILASLAQANRRASTRARCMGSRKG